MITTILSLFLSISSPAHADVRNELGACFFNTTNQLTEQMSTIEKKVMAKWQNEMMTTRNLECTELTNLRSREKCQIEGLLNNINDLKNLSSRATNLLDKRSREDGPCSYLTLFSR